MNEIESVVTAILTKSTFIAGHSDIHNVSWNAWQVEVLANSWGRLEIHRLTFQTKQLADEVKVGYVFKS